MFRPPILALAVACAAIVIGAAPTVAGAAVPPTAGPHITVTPDNVMVNATVSLRGTGFAPDTTLTVSECSMSEWVVTANPCLTDNMIDVSTNAHGRFTAPLKAELCARTSTGGHPVTRVRCFVGHPTPSGVDTITLEGAARLVVTYP